MTRPQQVPPQQVGERVRKHRLAEVVALDLVAGLFGTTGKTNFAVNLGRNDTSKPLPRSAHLSFGGVCWIT